jgi:hypothetical protein
MKSENSVPFLLMLLAVSPTAHSKNGFDDAFSCVDVDDRSHKMSRLL